MNPDALAAIAGLQASGRNTRLNQAFASPWQNQGGWAGSPTVPEGDTRFDPFMGSGWDHWLDAAGASRPGGVKMGGQLGNQAIGGLQRAIQPPNGPTRPNKVTPLRQEADAFYGKQYPGV